jgi:hypothetical protein
MTKMRPSEVMCFCGKSFPVLYRPQGGGNPKKYCSRNCRSRDWAKGNPEKRKATVTKYEETPKNKARKLDRFRIRRYGWNQTTLEKELARQNHSCYGCLKQINSKSARIDHCHTVQPTKVRGILCNNCNSGLGFLEENPATMRRLTAYLDHDRSKICVYLIGSLKNGRIPLIGNTLRSMGFDVFDEWITPGPEADENWQKYEALRGRTYTEALRGRAARNIFLFDRAYLDLADIVIMVAPAGKSAMIELGYAKGRGKQTFILLDGKDPDRYDIMPGFADKIFFDVTELVDFLDKRGNIEKCE